MAGSDHDKEILIFLSILPHIFNPKSILKIQLMLILMVQPILVIFLRVKWTNNYYTESKEEYDDKVKEIETVFNPFIQKIY